MAGIEIPAVKCDGRPDENVGTPSLNIAGLVSAGGPRASGIVCVRPRARIVSFVDISLSFGVGGIIKSSCARGFVTIAWGISRWGSLGFVLALEKVGREGVLVSIDRFRSSCG